MQSDDWDALLPDSPHVDFFRSRSWPLTQLGPLSTWSVELRICTLQAFADLRPACLYWGPSRIAVYNEAFVPLAGRTHPALMGASFAAIYPEIVRDIYPLFEQCERTRKASTVHNTSLLVERNGFLEEAIFDGCFVPLFALDGSVGGFYNSLQETTMQILLDRRQAMCNLIAMPARQFTSSSIYGHVAKCLAANPLDIPFAFLYRVGETESEDKELLLMEVVGMPLFAGPQTSNVKLLDDTGIVPLLRAAQARIVTQRLEKRHAGIDWEQIEWKGHGQAPQYVTTIPIGGGGRLYGFLIVGNNPRRPLDDHHHQFMTDLQRDCTSAVVATISMEEIQRRNRNLQDQLIESERRIRYIAQHSNVGMMQFSLQGTLTWANEFYHSFIEEGDDGAPRDTFFVSQAFVDEYRPIARSAWQRIVQDGQIYEGLELQLVKRYYPPVGESVPTTVLLSAFPYKDDQGSAGFVMACVTEVSRLKWAESWQAQMAHEATEAKRQQSEFIDSISHEVRNPLSAILQLADGIARTNFTRELTLEDCKIQLREHMDSASTILDCVRHQKRVLDDVLTLSKLDFASIYLTPSSTDISKLVKEAVSILAVEAAANSIALDIVQDSRSGSTDRIMCDSLRISQILINLLSNAIKFTKLEEHRSIRVIYAGTLRDPSRNFPIGITWAKPQHTTTETSFGPEWGVGDFLYLTFMIEDTGSGMNEEELARVFKRFEQATPKTSIKYGGSGLGLYISQSLVEKHNGRIGAFSIPGKGTTFAFYVKALKSTSADRRLSFKPDSKSIQEIPLYNELTPETLDALSEDLGTISMAQKDRVVFAEPVHPSYHLLLAEDNLLNQRLLQKQLTKAGCTVSVANHGIEALDLLCTSSLWATNNGIGTDPDVILMDWEMPVMDGLACTREIRRLEAQGKFTRHPEIIAITANVRKEQIDIAMEAGVDAVLAKPFIVSELLELIAARLRKRP